MTRIPPDANSTRDAAGLTAWRFRPAAALQETAAHLILLGLLLGNGLGYTGGLLLLVTDLWLTIVLSMAVHRDRRWVRSLFGLVGVSLLLSVFLGFSLLGYAVAISDQPVEQVLAEPRELFRFDAEALRWAILLAGAHLLAIYVYSRMQSLPARSWDLLTAFSGGVTFLTLMLLILVVPFVGGLALALASVLAPGASGDGVLVCVLVGARWLLAQGLLWLPEETWLYRVPASHRSRSSPGDEAGT